MLVEFGEECVIDVICLKTGERSAPVLCSENRRNSNRWLTSFYHWKDRVDRSQRQIILNKNIKETLSSPLPFSLLPVSDHWFFFLRPLFSQILTTKWLKWHWKAIFHLPRKCMHLTGVAQVCLGLITITGHSKMCQFPTGFLCQQRKRERERTSF